MSTYLDMDDVPDLLSQDEVETLIRDLSDDADKYVHNPSYEQIQSFLELPDVAFLLMQLTATNLTVSCLNQILHTLVREVVEHTKYWKADE
jgi:flagellar biosynthesis component FlhA